MCVCVTMRCGATHTHAQRHRHTDRQRCRGGQSRAHIAQRGLHRLLKEGERKQKRHPDILVKCALDLGEP